MKRVALLGGSFNPPHPGHFEMGDYIFRSLGVDEVWFLFSENWQKDVSKLAPTEHRMKMGEILAGHYPDSPFVMSDIQDKLKTHITYKVLSELKDKFPNHQFVWVMGADNLATFHTWEHFEDIIENYPVAVVDRPPYTKNAQNSYTALTYAHLKKDDAPDIIKSGKGWCFLDNPRINMSSSDLLIRLRNGETKFEGPFQDVADYIIQNRLYGIAVNKPEKTSKSDSDTAPDEKAPDVS
ncbi:MAG: nicotinate (nicotinamide) nucleotide adenylyltransferase [Alphaproteobacteria bacterium]|nr:nicotinate (nicotinamide) nucleotide adenylyltransferase [Alphaproteobacteria bacterium]